MGIQINIKLKDMLKAGWDVRVEEDEYFDDEGRLEEVFTYLVFFKDGYNLSSYSQDSFCADCNHWGRNKALFQELGLFKLPHTLP